MARQPSKKLKEERSDDKVLVNCYECGGENEVSRRALTITCSTCFKPLKLEDIVVERYDARRTLATVGVVTVEKKGQIVADTIKCGALILRGQVKSKHVFSNGAVLLSPQAELLGDVKAPSLAVGGGAKLEGHYEIGDLSTLPWREAEDETSPV